MVLNHIATISLINGINYWSKIIIITVYILLCMYINKCTIVLTTDLQSTNWSDDLTIIYDKTIWDKTSWSHNFRIIQFTTLKWTGITSVQQPSMKIFGKNILIYMRIKDEDRKKLYLRKLMENIDNDKYEYCMIFK